MRESIQRGTLFDPAVAPVLTGDALALSRQLSEDDVFRLAPGQRPSALVSMSYQGLHYLDLRILLILRNLCVNDVEVTLLLRDHQVNPQREDGVPPTEAKARLFDVLELLGVAQGSLRVVNWSDVGSRLVNDPDFHRYLGKIEVPGLGKAVSSSERPFTDMDDVFTTLCDVFLASRPSYLPSAWLLGGPSRYQIHMRGIEAMSGLSDRPAKSIPLPPVPVLASMPGIGLDAVEKGRILEDCAGMEKSELFLLHHAFFELLEDALGERLPARAKASFKLDGLRLIDLQGITTDALAQSLEKMQGRARKRRPSDVLTVAPARTAECLAALGEPRRAKILEAILRSEAGLDAGEVIAAVGLAREQLATVRRDLLALRKAGLVVPKGIKPIRYVAVARRIEISLPSL